MKLLVVDDSMIVRRTVERHLRLSRFKEIRMAANGLEALTAFEEFRPDVVTLDITMPEMDGLAAVEILRKKNTGAIILIISALADRSTAVEAMKRGAHGFLLKPITPEGLHRALEDLLSD
jgi:two-component system, chemotaxis family, chemotaxis protein CheY